MVNSPLPTDLAGECRKAAKILNSFIDPIAAEGIDKVIPSSVLRKAKGFAIFTVIKAGFLFSGRAGSGLVVARLEDGSWSAPSAIGTGGMGFGGQIGAEVTDFVIVLNSRDAVKSFSHGGNVTLGGNLSFFFSYRSVAAGPIGRNAEGAGSVSLGHVASIFSYSKTRGLFVGVSIEGSVIVERKDANSKFYHRKVTAKELLSGKISPPPQADVLYRALNSKVSAISDSVSTMYSHETHEKEDTSENPVGTRSYRHSMPSHKLTENTSDKLSSSSNHKSSVQRALSTNTTRSDKSYRPPIAPKPALPSREKKPTIAVALYDFSGEQDGDLGFSKGDIIYIIKKTESTNDW
ncbi:5056_t:CDS:10 [Acaulospora morrowiae]|uniref:5056_t:CDS:1 n=1 Tax=Acaulospora morrowiae TaxID=94023 RepID=A0A9N9GXE2_9GLOM|nr:5056_t:CDS:10 [Acaulospora morrowiae]